MKPLRNGLLLGGIALLLAACAGDDVRGAPGDEAVSVQEALAADGPVAVKGFVLATGTELRLCSALAESFPPQCGEPSLRIAGAVDAEFVQEGEVRWTEREVTLRGDVANGVLRVSATAR